MKTAIFLNTFAKMKNYDLESLTTYPIRNIAIVSKVDFAKFQIKYGSYFKEIYCSPPCDFKEFGDLNYSFVSEIVQQQLNEHNDVRMICQSEDNLLLAAKIRSSFNLQGMGYSEILPFRHKIMMKDIINKAGLRVPAHMKLVFDRLQNVNQLFSFLKEKLGLPFLLKPTSALGGAGIVKIRDFKDFSLNYDIIKTIEYEAEEFIEGKLYHADSIVKNGETLFSVCCQYSNPNFDFQSGKSVISCPLKSEDDIAKRILEFSVKVTKVMNLRNGVSHLEVFLTAENEIIFLEVAARSPGAVITPMYREAFNIPFEDIAYKIEMDIAFAIDVNSEYHYMSGILPKMKGKVLSLNEPNVKSDYKLVWQVQKDDILDEAKSLRDQVASIILWNRNYDNLLNDFNYLTNYTAVTVG